MIGFYGYGLIFILSCLTLFYSGRLLLKGLSKMARFLQWKEFVVAFFIVAIAGSLPNLFVGINSAIRGIPQLSFGDVVGGNVINLTLAVALVILIAKVTIPARSKLIQTSSIFTVCVAILPIILILDGTLGRGDGLLLISFFFFYVFWLFSKEERFKKIYKDVNQDSVKGFRAFMRNLGSAILALFLLLAAAEGIVSSASFFAQNLHLPLSLIGILIVGLGNALPETYFAVVSAKKGEVGMILGNLMGCVIITVTLVLGIVALICPIKIVSFSTFAVGRLFLIISAVFFFFCVRTDCKITKREALFLLLIYIFFVFSEILMQ